MRELALALPWASYLQAPADIWLGQRTGAGRSSGLAVQAVWSAVLLLACAGWCSASPTRKVVVQGG